MAPQTSINKAISFVQLSVVRTVRMISSMPWQTLVAGAISIALVITATVLLFGGGKGDALPTANIRSVEVKSIAELSNQASPLTVVGQVSSQSEATVRAEHSGQVTRVNTALGNNISAGSVAAELENASERAAVLQAEASVEAAQANLSKITGGARSEQRAILESNLANSRASLEAARAGAVNALLSAYAAGDNTIHGTDKMFTNPNSIAPVFLVLTSNAQLNRSIDNTRTVVGDMLKREELASHSLSASSALASEIKTAEE